VQVEAACVGVRSPARIRVRSYRAILHVQSTSTMLLTERPEPRGAKKRQRRVIPWPSLATRPFEGAALLDELDGIHRALFQWARDVALWIQTAPEQRPGLFRLEAAQQSEVGGVLARPCGTIQRMRANPNTTPNHAIADACTVISEWARDAGELRATEVCFAELAAGAANQNPELGLTAGRVNRRHALYARARHWYEAAIDLAKVQEDRSAQAAGYLSWANMEFQRGKHAIARRLFLRAWRTARKFRLRELGGAARHNLMTLALELERYDEAQEHALAAFRFYGRQHERIQYFAHDVAQLWAWQGYFSAALPIFVAAAPLITNPKERIKLLANLGRAAAGLGDTDAFFDAWEGVTGYLPQSNEHLAEAYVNIGEGALLLGLQNQAHEVAERALALARQRGEASTEAQAEALLWKLRGPTLPQSPREPPDTVKALSRWLLRTLQDRSVQE
jgi:tetratricopeptide (TPR) repeat protein